MNKEISWLVKASEQYKTQAENSVRVETNFGRAQASMDLLREKVLPVNTHPNILLIGVGYKGGDENPLVCTYSPFVLAAFLEAGNIDYRMSIVDIAGEALADVRSRKSLYLTDVAMGEMLDSGTGWRKYLSWTHQEERVLHEGEEGLIFGYTDRTFPEEFYLNNGIHAAEIPQRFKTKLQRGEITLIEGDIAVTDLGAEGFDFAECMNVLYQLSAEGQMLALANIAKALNPGGLILLNDLGNLADNPSPVFDQLGGWLAHGMLKDIDLEIVNLDTIGIEVEQPRGSYTTDIIWAQLRKTLS